MAGLVLRVLGALSLLATLALAVDAATEPDLEWWGASAKLQATVGVGGLLTLYAATFLAYWRPRRLQARPFALVTAIGLAVATAILGMASYWGCEGDRAWLWTPVNDTLGLFVGNVDPGCAGEPPVALQAAGITALLTTLTTVAAAIVRVFRDQWDRLQVRLARSVVVVVGLNQDSIRVLEQLALEADGSEMVVGVDTEPDSAFVAEARAFGARVLVGSKADTSWVRTLSRTTVRAAYLLSPHPDHNLSWFVEVERIARSAHARTPWNSCRIIVRLDDRWEADHWRRAHVLKADGILLDTIGLLQVTAQELIDDAVEREVDALVVLGSSPLAAAVLDELAQLWREQASLAAPRQFVVALVDPEAELLLQDHAFHERSFGNEPLSIAWSADAASTSAIAEVVARAGASPDSDSVLVVDCRDPSDGQYRSAQRISAARPAWRVLVRREGSLGIDSRPTLPNLVPFGLTLVTRDGVPEDGWTRIARRLHEQFASSADGDEASLAWEDLDDFYRDSNLRQVARALHIAEAAGRTWDPGAGSRRPAPLSEEEIARYAHLEHEDWRAYYVANGWTRGERTDGPRRNPYLMPWSELSADGVAQTVAGVANSLRQLTTLGYHPFARDSGPPGQDRYRRRGVVTAVRQDAPWTWTTEAGDRLTGAAGDWRVDSDGRTWSVIDASFRATYRHVEGDLWERTGVVTARRASSPEEVLTTEGATTARPGDWVVEDDERNVWAVPAERFTEDYEPTDGTHGAGDARDVSGSA